MQSAVHGLKQLMHVLQIQKHLTVLTFITATCITVLHGQSFKLNKILTLTVAVHFNIAIIFLYHLPAYNLHFLSMTHKSEHS